MVLVLALSVPGVEDSAMWLTFRRELQVTRKFPRFQPRHVRTLCSVTTNAWDAGGHRCVVLFLHSNSQDFQDSQGS